MRALIAQPKQTQNPGFAGSHHGGASGRGASSSVPRGLHLSSPKQAACAGTLACSLVTRLRPSVASQQAGRERHADSNEALGEAAPNKAVRPRTASPPMWETPAI